LSKTPLALLENPTTPSRMMSEFAASAFPSAKKQNNDATAKHSFHVFIHAFFAFIKKIPLAFSVIVFPSFSLASFSLSRSSAVKSIPATYKTSRTGASGLLPEKITLWGLSNMRTSVYRLHQKRAIGIFDKVENEKQARA
jgi:hypothetical protein